MLNSPDDLRSPRPLRRAGLAVLALLVLALVLAGCGSSTKVVTDSTATNGAKTGSTGTTTTGASTSATDPAGTASTPAASTPTAPAPTTTTSTGAARTTPKSTGGASPSSTSTATTPTTSTGTRTTAAVPYEASCGDSYEDISGLSCDRALPVMNAWNGSQSCEISDQYGSPTSSHCSAGDYACSAHLGFPPGQTEGERSAIVSCSGEGTSLSFIRGT